MEEYVLGWAGLGRRVDVLGCSSLHSVQDHRRSTDACESGAQRQPLLHCHRPPAAGEVFEEMGTRGPSARDWSEMPFDALTSVFAKLGAVELLMGAGLVCRSWLEAAKAPELWRAVVMMCQRPKVKGGGASLCAMAKAAVDRSGGRLEKFAGRKFVTDELLQYIADRSPSLKSLRLINCSDISEKEFMDLIIKFPQLEELLLIKCQNVCGDGKDSRDVYEAIGGACSQLKRFVLRHEWYLIDEDDNHSESRDVVGIATMKQLRHLTLNRIDITNKEVVIIIDSCPYLEHLCMYNCRNTVVDDALLAKCAKIKTLKLRPYYDNPWVSADLEQMFFYTNQDRHSGPHDCCCADDFRDTDSDYSTGSDYSTDSDYSSDSTGSDYSTDSDYSSDT